MVLCRSCVCGDLGSIALAWGGACGVAINFLVAGSALHGLAAWLLSEYGGKGSNVCSCWSGCSLLLFFHFFSLLLQDQGLGGAWICFFRIQCLCFMQVIVCWKCSFESRHGIPLVLGIVVCFGRAVVFVFIGFLLGPLAPNFFGQDATCDFSAQVHGGPIADLLILILTALRLS